MDRNSVKRAAMVGVVALLMAATAGAATFNLFSPANGVLKGNASTYITTPAVSSDIRSMWTGTCDNTTYLRGDGSCQTPPGAGGGTVNSVALSAPSVFSVGGSPVTNTGTLALSFATGQTANSFLATPDGSSGALSLRQIVDGDLPEIDLTASGGGGVGGILPSANGGTSNGFFAVSGPTGSAKTYTLPNTSTTILTTNSLISVAQGGTGANTLSGLLLGNGTSPVGSAASSDVIGLWTGTCNSGSFLRGDGSCQTVGGSGTVTSVAATVPSVMSITGSPVTTSGTLAIDWATGQTANRVLASPNGAPGAVALRALVGADIPAAVLSSSTNGGVTGNLPVTNLNGGTGATANTVWHGDATWGAVSLAADVSGDLPFSNLTQGPALSVLGVTGNSTADVAGIAAGTDNQVLRRSGTALAFGAVNLASSNAVTGTLPDGNLSSNVALKNAANTFTANQSISNAAASAVMNLQTAAGSGRSYSLTSSSDSNFYITDATAAADRLRISSAGNFTVGAPSSGTAVAITGVAATAALSLSSSGTTLMNITSSTRTFQLNSSSSGTFYITDLTSGIDPFSITGSTGAIALSNSLGVGTAGSGTTGEIRATNNITAYYSSDARLKENVKAIPDALAKVQAIRGVTFDWTDKYLADHGGEDGYFNRKHDVGVIAQEVQKVLPEVVATRDDGTLAVKYDRIVALLIESTHELQAQNAELKAANDDLYMRVKALEARQ